MNNISISVIICTYNRAEMLKISLKSLMEQETDEKFSYEILIVDDMSTDSTDKIVTEFTNDSHIPIKYIKGEGHGIAEARNRGIEESSFNWIAFFDDDQIAKPNWLNELILCALKTGAHCVGGVRLLGISSQQLSQLSFITRKILGEVNCGNEIKKCKRKEFPAAGNILLKKTIFDVVGKFDDSLVRAGEDIEFAQRLRNSGIEAWYTSRAVVYHIIPPYRMERDYMIWSSLRAGDNFAYRDYLEWGLLKTVFACFARINQAIFINLPLYFWYSLFNNKSEELGRECLLWRAYAYTFHTLYLIAPKLFNLESFFSKLEFRKERDTFQRDNSDS